jgi:hypothetical protein
LVALGQLKIDQFHRKTVLLLKTSSVLFFGLVVSVYIIEHWFVGLAGFSVVPEETMTTGLEVAVVGFILIKFVICFWELICLILFDLFYFFFLMRIFFKTKSKYIYNKSKNLMRCEVSIIIIVFLLCITRYSFIISLFMHYPFIP